MILYNYVTFQNAQRELILSYKSSSLSGMENT